ncbi:MAG: hypothetical protein P4L39_04955 [Humidesulfovibrio sp.]|nr:hypothetical protein [Humidesulfovibrio sp.]
MTLAILMLHALLGMLFILAAGFVYVDVLNVSEGNLPRIRCISRLTAVLMWAAFFIGGYWYVVHYGPEKGYILKGPWPFAHDFFMETKEHVVMGLLLLATFLPIAATNDLVGSKTARRLMLWIAALLVLTGVGMEGAGAIISMGAKVALLPH